MHFTNVFLAFLFTVIGVSSAALPQSMNTSNGLATGTTTIGGRLLATNTIPNGGTNSVSGSLGIGNTVFPITHELLVLGQNVTNVGPRPYGAGIFEFSRFAYTTNTSNLNAGITATVQVGEGNTGNWTNQGYPSLIAMAASFASAGGSAGTVRRAAAISATVGGGPAGTNSAIIDEAVGVWVDAAQAPYNYFAGVKVTGLEHGVNNVGFYSGIEQEYYPPTGNWDYYGDTYYPSYFSGHVTIGNSNLVSSTNVLSLMGWALATNSSVLSATGTLAASASTETAISVNIAGSGSGANNNRASSIILFPGYTGSGLSIAEQLSNRSLGTGTDGWTFANANYGGVAASQGSTSGHNIGLAGQALGSASMNHGVFGRATSAVNSPPLNIGSVGEALSATVNVGGFFGLLNGAPTTLTSAALMADNGAVAYPIFIARDNGTDTFRIENGGNLDLLTGSYHGDASGISNAVSIIAGNCIVITTNADRRTFTIAVGNNTTNYVFWYTNTSTASSAYSPYNIRASGSIQSTNTATANTALTLNGAASGAAAAVISFDTNGVNKFKVDNAGSVIIGTTLLVDSILSKAGDKILEKQTGSLSFSEGLANIQLRNSGVVIFGGSASASAVALKGVGGNLLITDGANAGTTNNFIVPGLVRATNGLATFSKNTPTSITIGASPVNYTNATTENVTVFVDGVSVTGTVGINGTTIFNTIGQNTIPQVEPGDWVTITYTLGTPTAWYR